MSIRSINVQYVGNVLFLPKLERDVKLVVERDYGTVDQDKRFVMERTCKFKPFKGPISDRDKIGDRQGVCSECSAYMHEQFNYCQNCGAKVVSE